MNHNEYIEAIAQRLWDTQLFATVETTTSPRTTQGHHQDETPLPRALIRKTSWSLHSADGGSTGETRHRLVHFTITIECRTTVSNLDQLMLAAESAIHGADLGPNCIPAMTLVESGRYPDRPTAAGNLSAELDGSFLYRNT